MELSEQSESSDHFPMNEFIPKRSQGPEVAIEDYNSLHKSHIASAHREVLSLHYPGDEKVSCTAEESPSPAGSPIAAPVENNASEDITDEENILPTATVTEAFDGSQDFPTLSLKPPEAIAIYPAADRFRYFYIRYSNPFSYVVSVFILIAAGIAVYNLSQVFAQHRERMYMSEDQ